MKKISAALLAGVLMVTATGCNMEELGVRPRGGEKQEASVEATSEPEIKEEPEAVVEATVEATVEEVVEEVEEVRPEEDLVAKYKSNPMDLTPGELFKLFCQGVIKAETLPDERGNTYSIDANDFEFEDFTDATSAVTIEKPLDLDNDGDLEFVLNNMVYGDMYFDCKDGKVVCFAKGEGTAIQCSNQYYNGANWVLHYGSVSDGSAYVFDKYNGDLEITESFRIDAINEADGTVSYYKDDAQISADDYAVLVEKIFGYDNQNMMSGEELTSSEIKDYEAFLERDGYIGFVQSYYRTPEDAYWGWVFYNGAGLTTNDYPKEAVDLYLKAIGEAYVEYDLLAFKAADIRAYVEAKTGIANFDLSKMRGLTYVAEYDMCFKECSDVNIADVNIVKGVKNGPVVELYIDGPYSDIGPCRLTLIGTGDPANPFHFYSNRQLWEEECGESYLASLDGSDEKVTYTVSKGAKAPSITIIEDNKTLGGACPWMSDQDLGQYDVKEVLFCDTDGDEYQDVIMILDNGKNTIATVCKGCPDTWEGKHDFDCVGYAVTEWLGQKVKTMTADNVLYYIQNHQDEYKELVK